jgi:transcriptional regulator with XRE-family HTH domain
MSSDANDTLDPEMSKNRSPQGERLARAREAAGYPTQSALADAIKVRTQTIWRIETGGYPLSRSTARRLAPKLGVSEAWLMYGTPDDGVRQPPPSVEIYLASELAADCTEQVRARLRAVNYATLGVPDPGVKDVHRVRELIEFNLSIGRKRSV